MSAFASRASSPEPAPEPWPQGISRRASMRISDVLAGLRADFPGVSHSKLRFLEEQGLIDPVRTASGYRQYSPADVERLRFVLTEQRDSYLPLKVIKERLAELDAGTAVAGPAPRLAAPAEPGEDVDALPLRFTVESLAGTAGVETAFVDALVDAGVLHKSAGGQLDAACLEVVRIAASLAEHGIEPRHLRSLRTASQRHVSLVEQVVAPWQRQQTPSARAHAGTVAAEIGEMCARLHTVWVRQGVADATSG
ncbi:MerR-like DNA binding protein [Sediminihabitans luteus]|uniref:MerR-like DNA binding protein n=1 Tax=Sediminihabitans luteus TaxID=1138585 RepID=A0A2M9CQS2_9CELL|nr:MerR family transcriptional regulator [Sediminihabitans luteus]PJJ74237.1 MerR-like DNA binding protein [Sediminihabitans luteus]GII99090.1 MerR family transcriptional regulator [Sediminihabitans luteus]